MTLKSSGMKIDVITPRKETARPEHLMNTARNMVDNWGDRLDGFAVIAWDENGYRQGAYSFSNPAVVAPSLIPQFVAEGLFNLLKNDGEIL